MTHHHPGSHPSWRTAVALALAPWLVASAAVAPEHIHEADAHHPQAVVHRHLEPHHDEALETLHDHDGAELSHDGERVVWLDQAGVQPTTRHVGVVLSVVEAHFATRPLPQSWVAVSTLDGAPPHGPPRHHTSPRAPPSFS